MPPEQPGAPDQAAAPGTGTGFVPSAPSVALPKGGGALRGVGERFATNAANGTGSFAVPVRTTPGRDGFGPELRLAYDSGAGNGPFGFGWTLGVPAISRATERRLPRYRDEEESDTFVLSDADDLVPLLRPGGTRHADRTTDPGYVVHRYRPRVEGLFARIERWTDTASGEVHWRATTKDGVTSVYGNDDDSRVADRSDETRPRVFRWLLRATYDARGNAVSYEYAPEDGAGVDTDRPHERNRSPAARGANRYLKRVRYGNRRPLDDVAAARDGDWLFEVVLDYDEGHYVRLPPDPGRSAAEQHERVLASPRAARPWAVRPDPFSSYRAGFEIRTYRRCRRILMFHHVPDLPTGEPGYDGLVWSTELDYADLPAGASVEDELSHQGSTRFASFVRAIAQAGHRLDTSRPVEVRDGAGYATYLTGPVPPLEVEYSKAAIDDRVRELDDASVENLPAGLSGPTRVVDLDGEGVAGFLTEQPAGWFYKENLGGRLGPSRQVAPVPAGASLGSGDDRLLDLSGDGSLDLVRLTGAAPGFFARTRDRGWAPFRPFPHMPSGLDWSDPNVRLVDVDGDGQADVVVTADDAIVWHAALGAGGFGPARRVTRPDDEERGPRLVASDHREAIYVADMSGDGLADLVRVRNGDVSYWPNLGYGRFGAKVTLDDVPVFGEPDLFDHDRVRLADVDGSGTTDLVHLGRDGVRIYFNQAGNRLSAPRALAGFVPPDDLTSVTVTDLLGTGTACLVWSAELPPGRRPVRYVDLTGGTKPHLLVHLADNLGGETTIRYAPSTRFSVADKLAGRPWVTRLPFPVHVVEEVVVEDRVGGTRFATRYAYHHGDYDGAEREFRGFGMVEQWDTASFADGGTGVADGEPHGPPLLTRTWFHTGVYLDRDHVSDYFAGLRDEADLGEYYRPPGLTDEQARALLLEDTVLPGGLTFDEQREACRALKGSLLRSETYALDGTERAAHPYAVTEQTFAVRLLQGRGPNPYAVFHRHTRETVTYHYEREPADPRIGHVVTIDVDDYGNVLRAATVAYGRQAPDPALDPEDRARQAATLATAAETRVTNVVDDARAYRAPVPAESRRYEVAGLAVPPGRIRLSFAEVSAAATTSPVAADPDEPPPGVHRRLLGHVRSYFRRDDLGGPLPLGVLESRALPFRDETLALTGATVRRVFADRVTDALLHDAGYVHSEGDEDWWAPSGRVFFSAGPDDPPERELATATAHFFRPRRFRDPFGAETFSSYDAYDLMVLETRDALGNRVTAGERPLDPGGRIVGGHDYRTMQPALVMDANRNRSVAAFDVRGLVAGTAVMGKPEDEPVPGDRLDPGFDTDPTPATVDALLADPKGPLAARLLGDATTRTLYDTGAYARSRGGEPRPTVTVTLDRETHLSDPADGPARVRTTIAYSDGLGREIQRKVDAEPGPVPVRDEAGRVVAGDDGLPVLTETATEARWVCSGWTVYDAKARPVRQFEAFFTGTAAFERDTRVGVSPVLRYDAAGRVVATVRPDHSWQKDVFHAWRQESWDGNDTVLTDPATDPDVGGLLRGLPDADYLPTWYALRNDDQHAAAAERRWPDPEDRAAERAAARKAAVHAGTPTAVHVDANGRTIVTVAPNRTPRGDGPPAETEHGTRVFVDVDGHRLAVVDAAGRVVVRSRYDLRGNRVYEAGMDSGERWTLPDATGRPYLAWDGRGTRFRTVHDALRRPVDVYASESDGEREVLVGRTVYGEGRAGAETANLRGKPVERYDQSGVVVEDAYDFKGNPLVSRRRLARAFDTTVDWSGDVPLEDETYVSFTRYDALNRPVQLVPPHPEGGPADVVDPYYDEAGLLEGLDVWLGEREPPGRRLDRSTAGLRAVVAADHNAKGQRERMEYGNGAVTTWEYDPRTARLARLLTRRGDTLLQDLRYTYDPAGNVTLIRDRAQAPLFFRNQRVGADAEYTYDAVYRLVEATGREQLGQAGVPAPWLPGDRRAHHPHDGGAMARYVERYRYDAVGALTRVEHHGSDPAHPGWTSDLLREEPSLLEPGKAGNRLSGTRTGDVVEAYGDYDAHGNPLRMPHLPALRWDVHDRLRSVARQAVAGGDGGERTWYVYDGDGNRVRKVTVAASGAVRSERVYLGNVEVYRRPGAETLVRRTLHVTDDDQRIALVETRVEGDDVSPPRLVRYQVANHLRSIALELDADARVLTYAEYAPYGSVSFEAAANGVEAPARYRFSGKERDEESGFSYFGARYYAPWIAQWISPDPAGVAAGVHLYAYCGGNPVRHVDPDGAEGESAQPSNWNRFLGGLKVVGGVFEGYAAGTLIAAGIATSEFGVGLALIAAGGAVGLHAADTIQSGAQTVYYGVQVDSVTADGLHSLGMSRANANMADAGIGMVGSLGGSLVTRAPSVAVSVSTKAPSITLTHEAGRLGSAAVTNPAGYVVGHTRVGITLGNGTATKWTDLAIREGTEVPALGGLYYRAGESLVETSVANAPRFASAATVPVTSEQAAQALLFAERSGGAFGTYAPRVNDCTTYGVQVLRAAGIEASGINPATLFVSTALKAPNPTVTILRSAAVSQPVNAAGVVTNATVGLSSLTYTPGGPQTSLTSLTRGDDYLPDPALFTDFESFSAASPSPYSTDYLLERWSEVHATGAAR